MSKNAAGGGGGGAGWAQGLGPFSGAAEVMARFSSKLWKTQEPIDEEGNISCGDEEEGRQMMKKPILNAEGSSPTASGGADVVPPSTTEELDEASASADKVNQNLTAELVTTGSPTTTSTTTTTEAKKDEVTKKDGKAPAAAVISGTTSTGEVARSLEYPDVDPKAAKIGMSACLMGHEVRYNQGHCRSRGIMDGMGSVFTFVPVCPEVDIGLGIPRPTLRLVAGAKLSRGMDVEEIQDQIQLWCPEKGEDYAGAMNAYTKAKVDELKIFGIDGFVLKSQSPSCGMDRVKLYESRGEKAMGMKLYKGLFARGLMKEWPELAVTDEGRLNDEDVRNNFVQHVLCHQRWRTLDGSFKSVVQFHANHKYTLLAQSPKVLKELGVTLAKGPKFFNENQIGKMYYSKFFGAMKVLVGRGRHTNVLCHLAGHIKGAVDSDLYQDLHGCIDDYQEGLVPLVVPLRLLQIYSKQSLAAGAANAAANAENTASTGKFLVSISSYVQGAPRSLKAHTSISNRTDSKLPVASGGENVGNE